MKNYCINHPNKKALSFCHICKNYYCEECLIEGKEYYYCHQTQCYNVYLEERRKITESYETNPRFCPKCLDETLPESTGNLDTTNFVGTTLIDMGNRCSVCNSYVVKKCYIIFGIPVKSYGYYRIIQIKKYFAFVSSEANFYARKLMEQDKYKF